MRKLLLIIFLLPSIASISQTKNQKHEIDSLLSLSRNALFSIDLVSVLKNSQNALQKSKKINYSQGKARASYYFANALLESGNYKSALEYLSFSLQETYAENTPQLTTDIYRVRGRVYGNMGLSDISISEFKKALRSAEQISVSENRKYTQSLLCENLIYLYKKKGINDSVKYYLDQNKSALKDLKEDFIFRNKSNYYNHLAEYYITLQKHDLAILNLKKSIQITERYPHPYTSENYKLFGNIKYTQKQLDSALFYYFKALKNIEKTGLKNEIPPIYDSIASIYELQGNKDSAQNYRFKSMEIQRKITLGKTEATETVLKKIIEEKSTQISQKSYTIITVLIFIFFALTGMILFYFRKKREKDYQRFKRILKEIDNRRSKTQYSISVESFSKTGANSKELIKKETEEMLLNRLKLFEKNMDFLDRNVSLSSVAGSFKTNTKYLSYVIKKYKKKDFSTYINELKIHYIIEKLNNEPKYRSYKISYLAEECRFSSHSKFTAIFKTVTGLSPSLFLSYLEKSDKD